MRLAEIAELQRTRTGLTAAAGPPLLPPREWFEMPEPDERTPLTVTADGQLYGHAALWGTCHTGKPSRCVTPPKSRRGYRFFRTSLTELQEGGTVPTVAGPFAWNGPGALPPAGGGRLPNTAGHDAVAREIVARQRSGAEVTRST